MGNDRSPWQDGRRAWERLNGWHQDAPASIPGSPADKTEKADALDALADVGLVRRLLDQAELVAVRTARRHGKSWAEIATRLGVTRQSTWERWRDLDDASVQPSASGTSPADALLDLEATEAVDRPVQPIGPGGDVPAEILERTARDRRRRSSVSVPNVVGMTWVEAREVLHGVSLVGLGSDSDDLSPSALGWPDAVVTDQSPESGAQVPAGSAVRLWVERGGGSGVREPRRPKPPPRAGRAMRDLPSDEAVG